MADWERMAAAARIKHSSIEDSMQFYDALAFN